MLPKTSTETWNRGGKDDLRRDCSEKMAEGESATRTGTDWWA